jgi:hypothetical protein
VTAAAAARPSSRARLVAVVALLLLVAVAVVLLTRAAADEPSGRTGRDLVEAVLAEDAEAPVVLPVELPRGYGLALGESARGAPGEDPVAAWVFDPVSAESGLVPIQLYVQEPGLSGEPPEGVLAQEAAGREVWVIAPARTTGARAASSCGRTSR